MRFKSILIAFLQFKKKLLKMGQSKLFPDFEKKKKKMHGTFKRIPDKV